MSRLCLVSGYWLVADGIGTTLPRGPQLFFRRGLTIWNEDTLSSIPQYRILSVIMSPVKINAQALVSLRYSKQFGATMMFKNRV